MQHVRVHQRRDVQRHHRRVRVSSRSNRFFVRHKRARGWDGPGRVLRQRGRVHRHVAQVRVRLWVDRRDLWHRVRRGRHHSVRRRRHAVRMLRERRVRRHGGVHRGHHHEVRVRPWVCRKHLQRLRRRVCGLPALRPRGESRVHDVSRPRGAHRVPRRRHAHDGRQGVPSVEHSDPGGTRVRPCDVHHRRYREPQPVQEPYR
mmetsp:Transcript_3911/g.14422  ORF Transcript_3911/g.14422 Transcript_3911/m.14422 type:complete len:202 (+) Transcript_3911:865-1470(+)